MNILSFDVESCNGNPKTASLCSFGYCLADEQFNILEQKDILINPVPQKFSLKSYKGDRGVELAYPEKSFRSSPLFIEKYEEIKNIFAKADLVIGFSIENDIKYLNCACSYYSLKNVNFDYVDVQDVFRYYTNDKNKIGLEKLCENYGISYIMHRSDDDARATLLILKNICNALNLSVLQILNKYKIVMGNNNEVGYTSPYSISSYLGEDGLFRSVKFDKILFDKFQKSLKKTVGELKGKKFNFTNRLAYGDVNFSRSLLKHIYLNGGVYCSCVKDCNTVIKLDEEEISEKYDGKNVIDLSKLLSVIGKPILVDFKDQKYLSKYFSVRKVTDK